jgi:hypothetical protein
VVQDIKDDEGESKTTREEIEEHMTMEERMIRAINSTGGKPKLDTPIYYEV